MTRKLSDPVDAYVSALRILRRTEEVLRAIENEYQEAIDGEKEALAWVAAQFACPVCKETTGSLCRMMGVQQKRLVHPAREKLARQKLDALGVKE